ncbi:hypothetical protein H0I25_15440 [Cellulophaga sp. HaHa_2_95]|uniref:hypothetical protein n=1 Tax=Cellulophaga sp. HaHa_2_95 TaxID=2745558 RepID=UPI001C4ED664|nr:hypothetical protein [Cellulophaga sp. HaHa_2_95]QXP55449.1 hypothetical protein H0I25_15440 [Cellulophaga sp. HaHa_2_95]
MDIFNSNRKLEELVMFGIDWGIFLRHDMEGQIAPFMYLKNGDEEYVRMLMTDGDPLEYAKKVLAQEEKPFQQFIVGYEGYLSDDTKERVDTIIVHGFDVTQEKGVSLGQMFSPKENGAFKKIDKVTFLGNPDVIIPLQPNLNPDYSVEEIGFNAIALGDNETGLTKYVAILTHDSPTIIANTCKQFLRGKFSSEKAHELSGDFEIKITDNCIKNTELLSFLVTNAINEVLTMDTITSWGDKYKRKVSISATYNNESIYEVAINDKPLVNVSKKQEIDISKLTTTELDQKFMEIINIPNARTNIEALTKMSELLKEYEKRGISTPDKRNSVKSGNIVEKKWWQFWK